MKFIKPFTFILMASAACISVWFVSALKPTSVGAFIFFAAWLVAPYVILAAALIFLSPKGGSPFQWFAVAALVTVAGMLMLADVIFWHKDAQGAIAVLMVPLFQGIAYAVVLPLALWVSRNARS
ncbi:MAG: hypothetical protein Q8J99_17940 [Sulfuritalea sp.]|nr:hypothetical protein [Sulfuritalea sp.]